MVKQSLYSDGGARGNPGPAASAFVFFDDSKVLIHRSSKFLGSQTNNYAEYQGVILALSWLTKNQNLIKGDINFFMDSELVVKQINGIYKVKEPTLQKLNQEVKDMIKSFSVKFIFQNIPRADNKLADQLVNEELDKTNS